MPSACAVTRYGPPTRSPVAVNTPLALVVVVSDVPVGRCTIATLTPAIGSPSAPTTKPARLLVVSCATATGPARTATKPAPRSAAGTESIEDIGPKFYNLPAWHGDPVEWVRCASPRPSSGHIPKAPARPSAGSASTSGSGPDRASSRSGIAS